MIGYKPPFSWKTTAVYAVVEDSEGRHFCFKSLDEWDLKNVSRLVEILNESWSKNPELYKYE